MSEHFWQQPSHPLPTWTLDEQREWMEASRHEYANERRDLMRMSMRFLVTSACAAIAMTFASACAPVAGGAPTATPLDHTRLDAQLLAMVDRRERDTLLVDSFLLASESERRARAALAIGQVQMRARYATLRRLLVDPDTAVAANAAFALGLGKDTASLVALGRAVAGAPDPVAREAAWALGELGDVSRTVLSLALGEGSAQPLVSSTAAQRSGLVRAELLLATVKLRAVPVTLLTPWLADTSLQAVRAAAYTIARPRVAAGVRAMLPLARHRDELVRQHVARALARTGVADSLAARAREALVLLIADSSALVRANAVRSLASFGPSIVADMQRALNDRDQNVRVATIEAIGSVFLRDADLWRRAWSNDTSFVVRHALLVAARGAGSDAYAAAESLWTRASDWRQRATVVESRLRDPKFDRLALARAFAADADGRVRSAAIASLDTIALAGGDIRALLRRAVADADPQVRSRAIAALARKPNADDLPAVLDQYAAALRENDDEVRDVALRYVARTWDRDSARISDALRRRLSSLTPPATAAERALTLRVTPLAAWKQLPTVDAPRPQSDYQRIASQWLRSGAKNPTAVLHTSRGDIIIELYVAEAPLVVEAFINLARNGYYRDTWFHRVVPNFVAQDGNPRGDGSGGPGFTVRDAWTRRRHDRGSLGLATSGPDTGGAQYYFCHSPQPHLDGHYTVFGHIVSGYDVFDRIVQGDRVRSVEIRS